MPVTKKSIDRKKQLEKEYFESLNNGIPFSLIKISEKPILAWKCEKGHIWRQGLRERVYKGRGCPQCRSGSSIPQSEFNLEIQHPKLATQWHPQKNGDRKPLHYRPGSGYKAWWICEKGHQWQAQIYSRAIRGHNCPKCKNFSTSLEEIRIFSELSALFTDAQNRYKEQKVELDVFLPSLKIGLEFDGNYWHRNKQQKDSNKTIFFKDLGIKIIRIRQKPLQKLSGYDVLVEPQKLQKKDLDRIIISLNHLTNGKENSKLKWYLEQLDFINDQHFKELISHLPNPFPKNSLQYRSPELSNEWSTRKNHPLRPRNFSYASGFSAWWTCTKGHSWLATISSRYRGSGCPYCSGRFATSENNLQIKFPELLNEWDTAKNDPLTPLETLPNSGKKIWWRCKEGHSWQATVQNRTRKGSGCPYCSGRIASPNNSLLSKFPKLAAEFDNLKNKGKTAKDFKPNSHAKVWWICANGHHFTAIISNRVKQKSGCPICNNRAASANYNLKSQHPELMKEWDFRRNMPTLPNALLPKASKKVWWICQNGHSYKSSVHGRTKGKGCPYCAGKLASKENNVFVQYPELMKEWDFEINNADPKSLTRGSNLMVWWRCRNGHRFEQSVKYRTRQKYPGKCPHC